MAYRANRTATFDGSGSVFTAALPAGWAAGDVCLAFLFSDVATGTITTGATGWTLLHGPTDVASDIRGYCYYRILQAGDGTPSWTWSGVQKGTLTLVAYSGRAATAPVEASVADTQASTASAATSSITTTTDLCDVVVAIGDDIASSTANQYTAYTGGFTERVEVQDPTSLLTSAVADVVRTPAGAGGVTITKAISDSSVTFLVALKPAAGGGGGGATFVPPIMIIS